MTDLTRDQLKEILVYSPKRGVFTWVNPPPQHAGLIGDEAGSAAPGDKPYWNIQIGGRKYKRSRLAFLFMTGLYPKDCIDHINGDSLDDRWVNLREATITQNAWNHKGRKKQSDTPMGVRRLPNGKYVSRIGVNKALITLGTFSELSDAVNAYQEARSIYYGEFA